MSEKTYERYTFPNDLTRIFGKSRVEMRNVCKFFLTIKTKMLKSSSSTARLVSEHVVDSRRKSHILWVPRILDTFEHFQIMFLLH